MASVHEVHRQGDDSIRQGDDGIRQGDDGISSRGAQQGAQQMECKLGSRNLH